MRLLIGLALLGFCDAAGHYAGVKLNVGGENLYVTIGYVTIGVIGLIVCLAQDVVALWPRGGESDE